jgi:hypothetical protein
MGRRYLGRDYKMIRVEKQTWEMLRETGKKKDTYDDIVKKLLKKNGVNL